VLKADELTELLDDPPAAVDADPPAVRLRDDALLELLYGSGLRVAELCGLRPGDVDLDRGSVTVWGKGSKQRQVPMSAPAVEAVRGWLEGGRPRSPTTARHPTRCSSTVVAAGSDRGTSAGRRPPGARRPTPTPSATRSRLISSTVVPT
jgi:site-specific recombinase XerC